MSQPTPTHIQQAISGMLRTSGLVQNEGNCTCSCTSVYLSFTAGPVCVQMTLNHVQESWTTRGKVTFCALFSAKLKYIINDINIQHSLMKVRIYTTNVISRGIFTPKMFFVCICYALKTPWVG